MEINSNLKINLLAIFACFLWSTAFASISIGLEYTSPIQFAGIRFILSGLLILPFIKNKRTILPTIKQYFPFIIKVAIFQTYLQYLFFYLGIARASGALSAIVIGSGPLFIAVMAHFMMKHEKLSIKKLTAILVGLSGISLVAIAKSHGSDNSQLLWAGIGFLLLCNLNGGYVNIAIAKNKQPVPPLILSSVSLFAGGVMLFITSAFFEPIIISNFPMEYYIALLWLSVLSAVALSIWVYLLKETKVAVSDLNLWKFIIPVSGACLSWFLLPDENPTVMAIAGMVLTGMALLWVNRINKKQAERKK